MLGILKIIAENLASGPASVPLPGSVPTPAGFRGPVTLNPEKCIGCGMCSYVCISDAVTGEDLGKEYAWAYEPGRCTFCARCMDCCPMHALSMAPNPVEPYEHVGERAEKHLVQFRECPECGDPVRHASEELLHRAFREVTKETRQLAVLCERCRRRRLQRNMATGVFAGEKGELR